MNNISPPSWPPDYKAEFQRRLRVVHACKDDEAKIKALKAHYKHNPVDFINDWGITYDPRNISPLPKTIPMMMFQRQRELIDLLHECLETRESALIEKCRDMGASWGCVHFSVWLWLFNEGSAIGWGSRKEDYVDKAGDMKAIFPKIRMQLDYTPAFLLPHGFSLKSHSAHMKIINPETGASITGEAGDNIGRGGRTSIFFKDESAHYERPELIEAALGDNTEVQIDISSVNGTDNVFYGKRQAGEIWEPRKPIETGITRVFIMDWREHPAKTQDWYNRRRDKAKREGLMHVFAQEVDRDYAAAVTGVVIPAVWARAAVDAHKVLGIDPHGKKIGALDVADEEGRDVNAILLRDGILAFEADIWNGLDTTVTAQKAVSICRQNGVYELQYDCIGVGAGVKGETNRLVREGQSKIDFVPWNAGGKILNPEHRVIPHDNESPKNKEVYANLKAQGWFMVRARFEKTYKAVTQGAQYAPEELISISSEIPYLEQLINELSQPTSSANGKGLTIVDKAPKNKKSPNIADAFIQAYWPIEKTKFVIL